MLKSTKIAALCGLSGLLTSPIAFGVLAPIVDTTPLRAAKVIPTDASNTRKDVSIVKHQHTGYGERYSGPQKTDSRLRWNQS